MVELAALLLCDRADRDEKSGKWTLAGVFDVVWAERFPAVHAALAAYLRLRHGDADAASHDVTLALRTPSGDTHEAPALTVAFGPRGVAEAVVRFEKVPLPVPGDYRFEVRVDGKPIGDAVLTVSEARGATEPLH